LVERSRTILKYKKGLYHGVEFGEVTVSNADTYHLENFHATTNPLVVYIFKKSDATAMTCTYAAGTHVVTITGAGSDIPCYYVAYGVNP